MASLRHYPTVFPLEEIIAALQTHTEQKSLTDENLRECLLQAAHHLTSVKAFIGVLELQRAATAQIATINTFLAGRSSSFDAAALLKVLQATSAIDYAQEYRDTNARQQQDMRPTLRARFTALQPFLDSKSDLATIAAKILLAIQDDTALNIPTAIGGYYFANPMATPQAAIPSPRSKTVTTQIIVANSNTESTADFDSIVTGSPSSTPRSKSF